MPYKTQGEKRKLNPSTGLVSDMSRCFNPRLTEKPNQHAETESAAGKKLSLSEPLLSVMCTAN